MIVNKSLTLLHFTLVEPPSWINHNIETQIDIKLGKHKVLKFALVINVAFLIYLLMLKCYVLRMSIVFIMAFYKS